MKSSLDDELMSNIKRLRGALDVNDVQETLRSKPSKLPYVVIL